MSTTPESRETRPEADSERPDGAESPESPESAESAESPKRAPRPKTHAALVFDDPLSRQSSDDTDQGWGERPAGQDSAADLARFLDEKPPHHL
ncbi:hypothetical protein A6A06_31970 [Streptomyces sp. CB02923]|uniref:hypothetical protein n=1 Tax=Streptomyces sp. CB02923 TaxID=1718985 RepID=UPI000939C993|nr:hypothetical protein [Streptomyces sp. CB02923]OKH97785.1 hypothetical protein A6A06_31970 [Streptomyces sp. CB02923]